MEYDPTSLERKFYDTIVPIHYQPDIPSARISGYAHILGINSTDNGHAHITGRWKKSGKAFNGFVKTSCGEGTLEWPRLTLEYWLPEIRIYKVKDNMGCATLTRKPGKFFKVGLNDQCYRAKLLNSGLSINVNNLDLYSYPEYGGTIWTKNLFVSNNILHFNNLKVGLVTDTKVFLDDPDLEHLLPSWVKNQWVISHW